MTDISVSERRLSAALDRIDQLLEAGLYRRPSDPAEADTDLQAQLDAVLSENTQLRRELDNSDATPPVSDDAALAEAARRIAATTEQAARLAAANDDLAAANRILIEAAAGQSDRVEAVSIALEAEIEALRAARAAEIAQLGDIMLELERLMAGENDARLVADHSTEQHMDGEN